MEGKVGNKKMKTEKEVREMLERFTRNKKRQNLFNRAKIQTLLWVLDECIQV